MNTEANVKIPNGVVLTGVQIGDPAAIDIARKQAISRIMTGDDNILKLWICFHQMVLADIEVNDSMGQMLAPVF